MYLTTIRLRIFLFLLLTALTSPFLAVGQTCTTTGSGNWTGAIWSCTGGASLTTASTIVLNHPVTLNQDVTLTQAVSIQANQPLHFLNNKLQLSNSASNIALTTGINLQSNGNSAVLTIGGISWTGNSFSPVVGPATFSSSGLPVELLRFDGKVRSPNIQLSWTTATERDNARFRVERAGPDLRFEVIGEVRGAGTVQSEQFYSFEDKEPLPGVNYYRLEQVDFDGSATYSHVIALHNRQVAIRLSSANPMPPGSSADFHLEIKEENPFTLEIWSESGQLIKNMTTHQNQVSVLMPQSGVYTARFIDENGENIYAARLIVKH